MYEILEHLLYLLDMPQWSTSNEYPQHRFLWRNKKIIYILVTILFYVLVDRWIVFWPCIHMFGPLHAHVCVPLLHVRNEFWNDWRQIYPRTRLCIMCLGDSVGCASNWRPGGCGFDPRWGRQHSFVEIEHEIFSMVILSHSLIPEGQLSVSGERMCSILVNRLED